VANGKGVEDFPGVGKYAGCFQGDLRHGVGVIECGPLKYCESIAEILVMKHLSPEKLTDFRHAQTAHGRKDGGTARGLSES
jgi:hypothetical protein